MGGYSYRNEFASPGGANFIGMEGANSYQWNEAVRTTSPEKCDIFAQCISLNQLLQDSKNTANIFFTFRNHVKMIFLSQNIKQNF